MQQPLPSLCIRTVIIAAHLFTLNCFVLAIAGQRLQLMKVHFATIVLFLALYSTMQQDDAIREQREGSKRN